MEAAAQNFAADFRTLYDQERARRRAAEESLAKTVRALATALALRDHAEAGHAERVARLAMQLAERVAPELAADPELELGFLLHDVGHIGLRDSILAKSGPLDADELAEMRGHTWIGERIVAPVPVLRGVARQVVAAHHEHWDGSGYPRRLRGEAIPLPARIFAIADAFDAMTSDRPWRDALPVEVALASIRRDAGRKFDPELVAAFAELVGELVSRREV